jgi:transitional endoplasmic reticulum ATPase
MAADKIGQKHFMAALDEIGPSVTPETMKYYSRMASELRKKASREVERGEMYA